MSKIKNHIKSSELVEDDDILSDSDSEKDQISDPTHDFDSPFSSVSSEDKEGTFWLNIQGGYAFRTLIQFLREIMPHGNIFFTAKGITIVESSKIKRTLIKFKINDVSNVLEYFYLGCNEKFKIGMSFLSFWAEIKSLGKSDNLVVYKPADSDQMCLEFGNQLSHSTKLRIQGVKDFDYEFPKTNTKGTPDFTVTLKELSKGANGIRSGKGKGKCSVYAHKNYLRLENKSDNFNNIRSQTLGKSYGNFMSKLGLNMADVVKRVVDGGAHSSILYTHPYLIEKELERRTSSNSLKETTSDNVNEVIPDVSLVKLPIGDSTLKALSKLSNLNEGGCVKVFVKKDRAIVFRSNVGGFGKLKIILI